MLSAEDNDILCRVGPGTPMGNVMREYWIPAARTDELPAPDCAPLRVKLLGEELIAYRTTSGAVGLMQNACPHRGASMFFGRNEEEGLRCVYHGWKFDVTGACVDMPSEPAESNFKNKVHAKAYPTHERNGVIWTYMGPREVPPPLPEIEHNIANTEIAKITMVMRPCNYMQGWEGEMDTAHAAFLHYGSAKSEDYEPGTFNYYQFRVRSPKFTVIDTPIGTSYGAYRPAEEDTYYWRTAHMMFPFYAVIPAGWLGMYVPMDDDHTMHWEILVRPQVGADQQGRGPRSFGVQGGSAGATTWLPNGTGWYDRFNIDQEMANDYKIDREAQRTNKSYTGIEGIRQQDMAVTESMGTIYDRTREHLGTTDALIIRTRRKLIKVAKDFRDHGILPPGVDDPTLYHMRSGEFILPRSADFWTALKEPREAYLKPSPEPSTSGASA
jgi:phenylpropionate dioxygenase-like ring-hydroxylating dioxygenase large terminal subunit